MSSRPILAAAGAVLAAVLAATASAQTAAPVPPPTDRTVTAVFADAPPRIDGRLDEALWGRIEPVTAFTQVWPSFGAEGTERTEVRIAYDADHLYFAFQNLDASPDLILARNLVRGGRNSLDDHVLIGLDTYRDGRNAYLFEANALGTQDDGLVTDEDIGRDSFSWDAVFRSEAHVDETGWSMEVAIPFRQLRFPEGDDLAFGLVLSRGLPRKDERVVWPRIDREGAGFGALEAVSEYGVLRGLRGIRRGRNLEVKPYSIAGVQQGRPELAAPLGAAEASADLGFDVKYGLTSALTLDLTVNTDFAQVEADAAQINLTRFSLFFPEQREFFLERAGLFEHGTGGVAQTFFSRRIGLDESIIAGARVTGQVGPVSVGALNIETGPDATDFLGRASTNNTVVRARADVLPRATVGGIVTNLADSTGRNTAAGLDGQLRFGQNSQLGGWLTQVWDTDGPGSAAGQVSGRLATNRTGVYGSFSSVGRDYAPALGFVRRRDYRRVGGGGFVLRPLADGPLGLRRLYSDLDLSAYWGMDGRLQSSEAELEGSVLFRSQDGVRAGARRVFERLDEPFDIRDDGVEVVPVGNYTFDEVYVSGETNSARAVSAEAGVQVGGFFGGSRTELGAELRWRPSPGLGFELEAEHAVIDIGNGPFAATVGELGVSAAFSRDLFGRTLLQYDNFSRQLRANVRLNWIHTPGSDLFVVFNTAYGLGEDDPLDPRRVAVLRERVAVVKLTYLVLV